jgi:hypothetical protein
VCDGTGDGDVAASAGADFVMGNPGMPGKKMMAVTMLVRLSHVDWPRATEYSKQDYGWDKAIATARANGELPYYTGPRTRDMLHYSGHPRPETAHLWTDDGRLLWGGAVEGIDGTDADSLTKGEIECRRQWMIELRWLRKYIPGFENCRVEDSGVTVGVRQTRHIVGEYTYSGLDILAERQFPDTVAYIGHVFLGVPYRCLVPKGIDNLLIASRCLSVTPGETGQGPAFGAYNTMKSIPKVMSYGEAAGVAAALSAKLGVKPRDLDTGLLVQTLLDQKALLPQDEIERLIDGMRLPDGTPYRQYLARGRANNRRFWEEKGYRFNDDMTSVEKMEAETASAR